MYNSLRHEIDFIYDQYTEYKLEKRDTTIMIEKLMQIVIIQERKIVDL